MSIEVKVSGKLACFTRPENKVERVSYEVMTPSAARGLLEAIYWKPEFQWQVRSIAVLEPIKFIRFTRSEVKDRQSPTAWRPLDPTMRQTWALQDVAYIIRAGLEVRPGTVNPAKHIPIFWRRVDAGKCHHMPGLGCREFVAKFERPTGNETPIAECKPLGPMLHHMDYHKDGTATPVFFDACLIDGVMQCG